MPGLDGVRLLITGAGGGLGREYALQAAAAGAHVMVNDLGSARSGEGADGSRAESVAYEITTAGGIAAASHHDITDSRSAADAVESTVAQLGGIDAVICNAGILRDRSLHKMSDDDWDQVMAVHLRGTFGVVRAAWPRFREQRFGRVLVTSSTSGIFGNFGQGNYGAAKLGVVGLMTSAAIEGTGLGINVNAIAPYATTRMTMETFTEEERQRFDPKLVAPAALHLISRACTQSGSIVLAGGRHLCRISFSQSQGVTLSEAPTMDEVSERWEEAMDMADAMVAPTGFEPYSRQNRHPALDI